MRNHFPKLFILFQILVCFEIQAQCISGNCNNGKGTFISQDGTKYEGDWENGKKTQGTTYYTNGDKYVGSYLNNARHGEGAYYYKSGNRFEGIFVKGKKVKGIFYYEDNSRYEGQFENDKKHGTGTMYYADGREEDGLWQDDKYIDELGERAFSKTYAVIVGITKYAHPKMMLGASDESAQKLSDFLKATVQIPDANIKLLLNEAATKAGITVAIRAIFAEAKPEDRVIFYFAGHSAEGTFVPYDYDKPDADQVEGVVMSASLPNEGAIADAVKDMNLPNDMHAEQIDNNSNGVADAILVTDNEGQIHAILVDENQNGIFEQAILDTDNNLKPDLYIVDANEDGTIDQEKLLYDTSFDSHSHFLHPDAVTLHEEDNNMMNDMPDFDNHTDMVDFTS